MRVRIGATTNRVRPLHAFVQILPDASRYVAMVGVKMRPRTMTDGGVHE